MYFEIRVQAGSPEELKVRVEDNVKRGFEVVRYFEREREFSRVTNSKYVSADGIKTRTVTGSSHKHFGAIMRRDNRDRMAQ